MHSLKNFEGNESHSTEAVGMSGGRCTPSCCSSETEERILWQLGSGKNVREAGKLFSHTESSGSDQETDV